jgi:hypothetical protein
MGMGKYRSMDMTDMVMRQIMDTDTVTICKINRLIIRKPSRPAVEYNTVSTFPDHKKIVTYFEGLDIN